MKKKIKATKPAKAKIGPLHPEAVERFRDVKMRMKQLFDLIIEDRARQEAQEAKIDKIAASLESLDSLLRDELAEPLAPAVGAAGA